MTLKQLRFILHEARDDKKSLAFKNVSYLNRKFDDPHPERIKSDDVKSVVSYGLGDIMSDYSDESDDENWDGHQNKDGRTAFTLGQEPDGDTFEEIANELGFSVAGAKQLVDRALVRAKFLANIDEDEREIMVLNAMNDYIKELQKSGTLSVDDVALMKAHPDMMRELNGFREFLWTSLKRAMRKQETT